MLVMLIVLNFIPDHKSPKKCMGTVFLFVGEPLVFMYSQGHKTLGGKIAIYICETCPLDNMA